MTIKTFKKVSSELALASIGDDMRTASQATVPAHEKSNNETTLPASVIEAWNSIPESVRSALISNEMSSKMASSPLSNPALSRKSSTLSMASLATSCSESTYSGQSTSDEATSSVEVHEVDKNTGTKVVLTPLERAPENVFAFTKSHSSEHLSVVKKSSSTTITTRTKVVTTGRGWRNVFSLPISYDVNMVAHGTLLDVTNPQLLEATGHHEEGYNRRFAAIDADVDQIYGDRIRQYFVARGIELTTCVLNGGEADKRPKAVDKLLDELCAYKLRRREPFLAIGGGCLLDIAGMAACMYRRGVPFVRVPTTLLAIVDASVGVKNGVDYCCAITDETYKNRVGSFYAPSSCLLDPAFIATQDKRNIANGCGEILKLALVRSEDLFELLESHGAALIKSRFDANPTTPTGVSSRIIDLSIQIMLEELGPNLWEKKLDRCVDYGHTFSKLLEMVPGADIMHGEAVNVDGFFCVILSHLRGYISMDIVQRVFKCMQALNLPTNSHDLDLKLAWQSCKDAIEHRHGQQRIPLITEIGESICVSDVTEDELERALELMKEFAHDM
jgi:3-dehydroquinate synthase